MTPTRELEHLAAESRRRGLAPIGFVVPMPETIALEQPAEGAVIACGTETVEERVVGVFELSIFDAPLVIDREVALTRVARAAAERWAAASGGRCARPFGVTLESGVVGAAVEGVIRPVPGQPRPPLGYLHVYALTLDGVLAGGVLLQTWSANLDWPVGHDLLHQLRIVPLRGVGAAGGIGLPLARG
jgi:hypothetical protein